MKTAKTLVLMFALGLAWGGLRADTLSPSGGGGDTVTLKDGRVLHGDVVEESSENVVVMVDGVKRTFGRSFISKISYSDGTDPGPGVAQSQQAGPSNTGGTMAQEPNGPGPGNGDSPAPPAGTIPSAPPQGDLVSDISTRYKVPPGDVVWVRQQGIADADVPLVFLIAATAQVVPRAVVKLRLEGWTWREIEAHFGMRPNYIYYGPGPWAAYPYYYPGVYVGLGWGLGWGGRWGGGWGGRWR
jgi:hypothetical protein